MIRLKAAIQPKTGTKITWEPRRAASLSSPTTVSVRLRSRQEIPGGGAVSKLRSVDFQESQDWWGLLGAVSRESGFIVSKIEERSESPPLLQTLVQCTTEPVLGNPQLTSQS